MQSAEDERLRSAYDAAQRDASSSRSMNPPPAPARVRTSVPEHELHALTPEAKRALLWARHKSSASEACATSPAADAAREMPPPPVSQPRDMLPPPPPPPPPPVSQPRDMPPPPRPPPPRSSTAPPPPPGSQPRDMPTPPRPPPPPPPPPVPSESSTAETAVPDAERPLLPSWVRVPSRSRPGEFSYQHLPTGLKQTKFPETEPSAAEIDEHLAAKKSKKQASSGKKRAAPLMQNEPTAAWHAYLKKKKS